MHTSHYIQSPPTSPLNHHKHVDTYITMWYYVVVTLRLTNWRLDMLQDKVLPTIAHTIVKHHGEDLEAMFVMATMKGVKASSHHYIDTKDFPYFVFSDGSVLEFCVEYEYEVKTVWIHKNMTAFLKNNLSGL